MAAGASMADLQERIRSFSPDLIGISIMTYMFKRSYDIIHAIRQAYPSIAIIAGGRHISTLRKRSLKNVPPSTMDAFSRESGRSWRSAQAEILN
jgi:hypothetical protein